MRLVEQRSDIYSLVFVGRNFDFSKITLQELRESGVLPDELLNDLSIDLWSEGQRVFSSTWFKVEFFPDRLLFACSDASEKLSFRDICLSFLDFFELSKGIEKIGINYVRQFYCQNGDEWHRVGNNLMPKAVWASIFDDDENNFGLLNYEVKQENRKDGLPGHTLIRVKPLKDYGIEVLVNNHLELKDASEGQSEGDKPNINLDMVLEQVDEIFKVSNRIVEKFCKEL